MRGCEVHITGACSKGSREPRIAAGQTCVNSMEKDKTNGERGRGERIPSLHLHCSRVEIYTEHADTNAGGNGKNY